MYDAIFYVFAFITLVSGAIVAFTRNIAYAAFSLLFALFGIAGLYVMLGADFVGVSQLLIYVGGILVLFLFGMMLTSNIDKLKEDIPSTWTMIVGVAGSTALASVLLLSVIWKVPQWQTAVPKDAMPGEHTTTVIGRLFVGDFSLMFIAAAVAILVALVGAAMIARSDRFPVEQTSDHS